MLPSTSTSTSSSRLVLLESYFFFHFFLYLKSVTSHVEQVPVLIILSLTTVLFYTYLATLLTYLGVYKFFSQLGCVGKNLAFIIQWEFSTHDDNLILRTVAISCTVRSLPELLSGPANIIFSGPKILCKL